MYFDEVLEKYRAETQCKTEKGDWFERLMVDFLKTTPVYDDRFTDVWQWRDFAARGGIGENDAGIDIVAVTADSEFWAVQAKFFQDGSHISKSDLDGFLATSGRSFNFCGKSINFSRRLLMSTTNAWSANAENAIRNQTVPVSSFCLADLRNADVDWRLLEQGLFGADARPPRKEIRDYQQECVDNARIIYKTNNRGKICLACGTVKTFLSLKIAESETGGKGLVLFLAPSIALVGQTLLEWSSDAARPFFGFCVCSDQNVSRGSSRLSDGDDMDSYSTVDLPLPVTTSPEQIANYLKRARKRHVNRLSVIFSTYQSAGARIAGSKFDLMICDEARRTTGLEGIEGGSETSSFFTKIHDDSFLPASKRLYMTATPRLYVGNAMAQAKERGLRLYSMDNEEVYGPQIHRMTFSEAVERGYLSDYKVIVLTLGKEDGSPELDAALQSVIAGEKAKGRNEIDADDVTRFLGCLYAFSKRMDTESESLKINDPSPMRKVVAFCESIRKSRLISGFLDKFNHDEKLSAKYFADIPAEERYRLVTLSSKHIDGTMGVAERGGLMKWLEDSPENDSQCRILSNVFVLSEGVNVPTLDAVVFLSKKQSDIQIVQSVGRVMRRAPGKKFGYIVIPIIIPQGVDPEAALNDHSVYGVLWDVLKALKAHDDGFDSKVNKLRFNVGTYDSMLNIAGKPKKSLDGQGEIEEISGKQSPEDGRERKSSLREAIEAQAASRGFRSALYAKTVKMTGSERDMEVWANNVGEIAKGYIEKISDLVSVKGEARSRFETFVKELQVNINPSVNEDEVKRMLAQHATSMPVFEPLFDDYSFAAHNPVSRSMPGVIDAIAPSMSGAVAPAINKTALTEDGKVDLSRVRRFVTGIDNAEARERIVVDLYDKFFRKAFPDVTEKLGIVYTSYQIVDFINNSVEQVLRHEFGRSLADENVHVLDPFTGTGTFISRIIRSKLLDGSLERKYHKELHANEMVILPYYYASG
ncbi:MAG: DEAD/DEAH box helicase family protein [Deltaproteobacteria bacterium]|nr:DEAD/DEAH box helicase family protein [Deltaproteobacteria bacterium]